MAVNQSATRAFNQEYEKFFIPYLNGNVEQAKEGLMQAIHLIETSPAFYNQASELCLNYDRLCILNQRSGNEAGAQVALIKARYWYAISLRLNGYTDDETMNIIKLDTPEKVEKRVDDFDKGANDGHLPKYVEYITGNQRGQTR